MGRIVQNLRVAYRRDCRRAVQTRQVRSVARSIGASVSDAAPSFLTLWRRIVRFDFLLCLSKQKHTGQAKWGKRRECRANKRKRPLRDTRSVAWSVSSKKNSSRSRRIKPSKVFLPVATVPAEWLTPDAVLQVEVRAAQVARRLLLHRLYSRRHQDHRSKVLPFTLVTLIVRLFSPLAKPRHRRV